MARAVFAPPRFRVTPAKGSPAEVVMRPAMLAGAAVGTPQQTLAEVKIETVSTRMPPPPGLVPVSYAVRHRNCAFCPYEAGGRITSVVRNPPPFPVQACRPVR